MGPKPTTRLQVSGHRFLVRRMEHALLRGDVRMLDDPVRAQSLSLVAGCVVAAIAVAACGMLALLRPHGTIGDAAIVMGRESGALYVRVTDTLHPVLNLASARLIAGAPANPEIVSDDTITSAKRGPLLGIPGAPATIGEPLRSDESAWTVCDDHGSTTVVIGAVDHPGLDAGHAILVTDAAAGPATTYLLYDGRRARIDLRNSAVVRALRLDGVEPQLVSRTLLDLLPEAPAIAVPQIPQAGSPGPAALGGLTVGTVVRMTRVDAEEHYVVLAHGVQRIGEVVADMIRFSVPQPDRELPTVAADAVAAVPALDTLPISTYPSSAHVTKSAVVCTHWAAFESKVLLGDSLPRGGRVTTLAQADGDGPNIDAVVAAAGRSAYVRSTGVVGGTPGSRFLVDDSGVVYGIYDEAAAKNVGLPDPPVSAPWPVLAHLPRGPELHKDAASLARDALPPS
ncbi:type VII secretion protein EccB [Mycobacterium hubeiense]|uniref:type VII secretion protein EccB n=1 Tax=Mycobacterium hubeiense TaxID=1867256 RepID=UPI000C7ED69B|nr:type VII secretion protein EccB [Mycobacterium sp. QGD 101]